MQKILLATLAALAALGLGVAAVEHARSSHYQRLVEMLRRETESLRSVKETARNATVTAQTPTNAVAVCATPVPSSGQYRSTQVCNHGEEVHFSCEFMQRPVSEKFLDFVSLAPTGATLDVDCCYRDHNDVYRVRLNGNKLEFGTPYVLTFKAGLPFENGTVLAADREFGFMRPDLPKSVRFARSGRYLPPGGERSLLVQHRNVTNLLCSIATVRPENTVQLLAREEDKYRRSWCGSADDSCTRELALDPVEWSMGVSNAPNEYVSQLVRLAVGGLPLANGIYHMAVGYDEDEEAARRLICVTDLGISARETEREVRVWITSLQKGTVVPGATATVYAVNGETLASGRTDAGGEVVLTLPKRTASRYPFALVATTAADAAFVALESGNAVDETLPSGGREGYLAAGEATAFVWSDRGLYRHGEKVMVEAILRDANGNAPSRLPVVVEWRDPSERVVASVTRVTDPQGGVLVDEFAAPESSPSGRWELRVATPGKNGVTLGSRIVKVEEFVPPQIRVAVEGLGENAVSTTGVEFRVSAEHLFGGAARHVTAESAISFADEPFAPTAWSGFRFGDCRRSLVPNFRRLSRRFTGDDGKASFSVSLPAELGEPAAAVRLSVQGSAFETGGRPAYARAQTVLHRYPFYLGAELPERLPASPEPRRVRIAVVSPDGRAVRSSRTLAVSLSRFERVYSLRRNGRGEYRWESENLRRQEAAPTEVAVGPDGCGVLSVAFPRTGDYELALEDASGAAFCARIWAAGDGDDELRASLANPTKVELQLDRETYREGETPRLTIRSPFKGAAYLTVMRDEIVYSRSFALTNVTSTIALEPVAAGLAPNADIALSVVQAVGVEREHLAARAHGILPLRVRPRDTAVDVRIHPTVVCRDQGGSRVHAEVIAVGAAATATVATVTLVDEGIHLLSNERVPSPVAYFSTLRQGFHPLYDYYSRLLPVWDEASTLASGVKIGGDDGADLMGRVSPVPTRRFKPLSLWRTKVPLVDGRGEVDFELGEFVGEVRLTAVARGERATGAAAVRAKVAPKLVLQPDAPRFAAPRDAFSLSLSLHNRSGRSGEAEYAVTVSGAAKVEGAASGRVALAADGSAVVELPVRVGSRPGEVSFACRAYGFGESHVQTIELPVRPPVAWAHAGETVVLKPGERYRSCVRAGEGALPEATVRRFKVSASPKARLTAALDYLADYPYGCLEQTTSRMLPLVAGDATEIVESGVARVSSMVREHDFSMWPDTMAAPWDVEVSPYAAHFLFAAAAAGWSVDPVVVGRVKEFCRRWANGSDTNLAAYACHDLVLAGAPERDRMNLLYDARRNLPSLARARLARAYARLGDVPRAAAMLGNDAFDPKSVKEAAFAVLALLEVDPDDCRLASLVLWLDRHRQAERFHWGTTGDNAHALLALAAYDRVKGGPGGEPRVEIAGDGETRCLAPERAETIVGGRELAVVNVGTSEVYVAVSRQYVPCVVTNSAHLIGLRRRFLTGEGEPADLARLTRGDQLVGEIEVCSDEPRDYTDLVVEELLPACFEPEPVAVVEAFNRSHGKNLGDLDWLLRGETRDDRLLAFSRPVRLSPDADAATRKVFRYCVRVVSAGAFALPGTKVEAMYAPEIRASLAPARIVVAP